MHAALAGEIEGMGGGRAHGHARAHHPDARKRGHIGVDAAARRHQIVDIPGGQVIGAGDPAGLPHPRLAIGAHPAVSERIGKFALEKPDGVVGLDLALQPDARRGQRFERGFDMGHVEADDAPSFADHAPYHGAQNHLDPGRPDLLFDPAGERHLVIEHRRPARPPAKEQIAACAELVEDLVGDSIGEPVALGAVREQAAKRADDGIDGLSAKRRQAVDENHPAPQPGRFKGRRDTGDTGAGHTDIRLATPFGPRVRPGPDHGGGGSRGGPRCHEAKPM